MLSFSIITAILIFHTAGSTAFISPVSTTPHQMTKPTNLKVFSLRPAAGALMDSGKAFARSGEFLIDVTTEIDIYRGALSSAGAAIRNSGDCIAQAAASCRFKTAAELVCNELREAATCLNEVTSKLKDAVEEANADNNAPLGERIDDSIPNVDNMAIHLEEAGKAILQGKTEKDVGENLLKCGEYMEKFSVQIKSYVPDLKESEDAGQRMAFAADRMRNAACKLTGDTPEKKKPVGKAWIKG